MKNTRYEILKGLPAYGPMAVPVNYEGSRLVSEGYVVRFYKSNGEEWIANFCPGYGEYSNVFDYPELDKIIVFAGGLGYVMSPENEKPESIFGLRIDSVLRKDDGSLIFADDTCIMVFYSKTGELWESEQVSWDEIRDLKLIGNKVTGKSSDPLNSKNPWCDFSLDLDTGVIEGGSWRNYSVVDSQTVSVTRGRLICRRIKKLLKFWK